MEIGRKFFKNDNIQDRDIDVAPEWQIAIGRKQFVAVEPPQAIADAAAEETAAETANAVTGEENTQEEEVTNDRAQEIH